MGQTHGVRTDACAIDLFKAFDSLPRHLMYAVLCQAGLPDRISQAYAAFHESVEMQHYFTGQLGRAHTRGVRIPQGCPWIMMCSPS